MGLVWDLARIGFSRLRMERVGLCLDGFGVAEKGRWDGIGWLRILWIEGLDSLRGLGR